MKVYNKLVRDKIPSIIASQGKRVTFRAIQGEEFEKALKDKLLEEANELIAAQTEEELLEEVIDVLEVLQHLLFLHGTNLASREKARYNKILGKGSFDKGYFLESVED